MKAHDTLGRRRRDIPCSTGKRIRLCDRDLLWFRKLHAHGPLSSLYLYQFAKPAWANEQASIRRLGDLFHEDTTFHKGRYLDRPSPQFETLDPRQNALVYDLTLISDQVLKDNHLYSEHSPTPAASFRHWKHRFMTSCITASIELATIANPKLRYIPQSEILGKLNATLRIPIEIKNPVTKKKEKHDLIPDAVFAIEYKYSAGKKYLVYFLETDRNTEPNRSYNFERKSYRRTILQYRELISQKIYRSHYGLNAGALVLNVTTSHTHMKNLIQLTKDLSLNNKNNFMLFQAAPSFGYPFKPPPPLLKLLTDPWKRAGSNPFYINKP